MHSGGGLCCKETPISAVQLCRYCLCSLCMRSASFCCLLLLLAANRLFAPRAMLRRFTLQSAAALRCSACSLLHASAAYCAVFAAFLCSVCVLCILLLHTLRGEHTVYIMLTAPCFLLYFLVSGAEWGALKQTRQAKSPLKSQPSANTRPGSSEV